MLLAWAGGHPLAPLGCADTAVAGILTSAPVTAEAVATEARGPGGRSVPAGLLVLWHDLLSSPPPACDAWSEDWVVAVVVQKGAVLLLSHYAALGAYSLWLL